MKLIEMVSFLFSKNAGPYLVTFDVLFKDEVAFEAARRSGVFNSTTLARAFNVAPERIVSIHEYAPALAIKFTMLRSVSSGDFGDRTVFGSQLWAPLVNYEVPVR